LLGNLDNVLQVSGTILEDDILHLLAIIGLTVIYVEHLDTIFAIPQSFKHLKFPTDEFPRLGRALYRNFAIRVRVKRLKYVALIPKSTTESVLTKRPRADDSFGL